MAKKSDNTIDTEQVLHETVTKLRDLLSSIEMHGDGEHGSTIQDIARISVALTSSCAELRQHGKARRRELHAFPVEAVVERLRELPEVDRKRIAAELTGEHDAEGLL